MKILDWISFILLVIGGLNWGLVGAADFDLVRVTFGDMTVLARIVYLLVALAALYRIVAWRAIVHRASTRNIRDFQRPHPTI